MTLSFPPPVLRTPYIILPDVMTKLLVKSTRSTPHQKVPISKTVVLLDVSAAPESRGAHFPFPHFDLVPAGMVTGPSQHHIAVNARLLIVHGPLPWLNSHVRVPSSFRHRCYSSKTSTRQQSTIESREGNLPEDCFSNESLYPDLSLNRQAVPRNTDTAVDISKTRPASLQTPPDLNPKDYPATDGKPPLSDRAKHLFKIGKAYLAFYKTGFFNVWEGYKQTRSIRQKYAPHSLDTVAKYGGQVRSGSQLPSISLAEYSLHTRSRHDIRKLIPFSLVFAICGEFTPFVILALGTRVVPYTCRIPKQESKDLEKRLARENTYLQITAQSQLQAATDSSSISSSHTLQQQWRDCYRYNLTSLSQPPPLIGQIYHQYILLPRLKRHCETLVSSTALIHREGGFSKLDARSIFEWADKYTLFALHEYLQNIRDTRQTMPSIGELCTDDFRNKLAPACDAEAAFILERNWTRMNPECHWRTAYRTIGDGSPDTTARKRRIQSVREEVSRSMTSP